MKSTGGMEFSSGRGEPSRALRPLRILVVDDDRDSVVSLTLLLRDEGYDVRSAHSGRVVMGAILDFEPDVVILDIHLPEMSGWEVAKTIRGRRGRTRPTLIGISGEYRMGADKILAEIIGFDHYLLKPYEPGALLDLLRPLATASERP